MNESLDPVPQQRRDPTQGFEPASSLVERADYDELTARALDYLQKAIRLLSFSQVLIKIVFWAGNMTRLPA